MAAVRSSDKAAGVLMELAVAKQCPALRAARKRAGALVGRAQEASIFTVW